MMFNVPVSFEVEVPRFFEMSLGSLSQERMQQIVAESRRAEEARRLREQGMTPGERVEVPTRKMIDIMDIAKSAGAERFVIATAVKDHQER